MPEEYSKPFQISKMMRHIENPGIVRTAYSFSGMFRDIQKYPAMFRHVEGY